MNVYVDFDGVIVDSETHLFDDFDYKIKNGLVKNDIEYVSSIPFSEYLNNCEVIPGSIEYLIDNPSAIVLTKVCSIQEAIAKIKFLRSLNVFNNIVVVPYGLSKDEIVDPKGNILIDDTLHNIDSWEKSGGKGLYFNYFGLESDPWGNTNTKYSEISNLQHLSRKKYKK